MPTTTGIKWTYGGIAPYTIIVTENLKVINGKTYHELQFQQGVTAYKSFVVKNKGVYTAIGMITGMGNLEIDILKEGLSLGSTWEQTDILNGINVALKFTIAEKDINKTIEGKTYNNVINVKMACNYTYSGIETGIHFTTNYYSAKGVGLILSDLGAKGKIPLQIFDVK